MQVKEIMTHNVKYLRPESSIREAAERMRDLNVGPLPVCDRNRIVGIITDRDITVRAVAAGIDPNTTPVRSIMSADVVYCFENDDLRDVARLMEVRQVRRVPILSSDLNLVGVISLGDIAVRTDEQDLASETLEQVSAPE